MLRATRDWQVEGRFFADKKNTKDKSVAQAANLQLKSTTTKSSRTDMITTEELVKGITIAGHRAAPARQRVEAVGTRGCRIPALEK